MLPQLNAQVSASNSGLAGQVNTPYANAAALGLVSPVNGYFVGGYGSMLSQLFGRNFPNYSASISLTIPIHNRAAQADYVTDQLNFRQQLIQDKQLHNNIRQNVINSRVALSQARTAFDTSVEARKLQEQTAAGTRRKYELGTATILDVVITQRDTTTRELAEVQAKSSYIHSRINIENVLGRILQTYDVSIEDARKGVVGRDADPIPAVPPTGNQSAQKR
jgi:outer membrane protein TolC